MNIDTTTCKHDLWRISKKEPLFKVLTSRVTCASCGYEAVGKPILPYKTILNPIAANEVIVSQLLALLSAKGLSIKAPMYIMGNFVDSLRIPPSQPTFLFENFGKKPRRIAVCKYLGTHSRVGITDDPPNAIWPSWLYDFNRWIGRLDGPGDTNLLILENSLYIIPIDWTVSFPWATRAFEQIRAVDDFKVPHHPCEIQARSLQTIDAIKSLTDEDLWNACIFYMTEDVIPPGLVAAYWTGLCLRRNLLKKDDDL